MLELAELVRELRAELQEAMQTGEGASLRFELGSVQLDLTVTVEREGGASGKVRFWVVELGGDARISSTSAQRIGLTLTPRLAADGSTPYIRGRAKPEEE